MGIPAVGSSIAPTPTEAATASETSTIVATETPTSSTEEPTTTAKPGREPSDKVYRFNGAIWKTKRQDSYNTKAEGGGGGVFLRWTADEFVSCRSNESVFEACNCLMVVVGTLSERITDQHHVTFRSGKLKMAVEFFEEETI